MLSYDYIFVAMVTLAALSDVFFRRIPNALNFSILLSGILVTLIDNGLWEAGWSVLAAATTLGVLLMPFALGVYRGGDVKLCMGISTWLGLEQGLWVIGLGVIGGGVLGFLVLFFNLSTKKKSSVPMAVCFTCSGLWIKYFGIPFQSFG